MKQPTTSEQAPAAPTPNEPKLSAGFASSSPPARNPPPKSTPPPLPQATASPPSAARSANSAATPSNEAKAAGYGNSPKCHRQPYQPSSSEFHTKMRKTPACSFEHLAPRWCPQDHSRQPS